MHILASIFGGGHALSDKWNWVSFYWLGIWFLLGFGVPEAWALFSGHPENTLSDQVWRLEGNSFGPPWAWTPVHVILAIGFLWLAGHMIAHIWR